MSIERDMAFIHIKAFLETIRDHSNDDFAKDAAPKLLEDLEKLREE